VNKKGIKKMEDYKLNTYADGFGIWNCEITYPGGIGNTWEAEAIAGKSMRAAKRAIRAAIVERSEPVKVKRLSYKVAANDSCSVNHLHSLTIAEA
jgi:GH24 family phage-related lysozyme (muramidase)